MADCMPIIFSIALLFCRGMAQFPVSANCSFGCPGNITCQPRLTNGCPENGCPCTDGCLFQSACAGKFCPAGFDSDPSNNCPKPGCPCRLALCQFESSCLGKACTPLRDSSGCALQNCPCQGCQFDSQCTGKICPNGILRDAVGCAFPGCPCAQGQCLYDNQCFGKSCPSGVLRDTNGCAFPGCPCAQGQCLYENQCFGKSCPSGVLRDTNGCAYSGCPCFGVNPPLNTGIDPRGIAIIPPQQVIKIRNELPNQRCRQQRNSKSFQMPKKGCKRDDQCPRRGMICCQGICI